MVLGLRIRGDASSLRDVWTSRLLRVLLSLEDRERARAARDVSARRVRDPWKLTLDKWTSVPYSGITMKQTTTTKENTMRDVTEWMRRDNSDRRDMLDADRERTEQDLRRALREIVEQKQYDGFGDPASRLLYVTTLATHALQGRT